MKPTKRLNILYACSEVYPLIKTGGLADVAHNLPTALHHLGYELRIIIPGYRDALIKAGPTTEIARIVIDGRQLSIRETSLPNSPVNVWLLQAAEFSDRSGDPYTADGNETPWPDNAQRFNLFCRAVSLIARGLPGLNWRADIVHCNDWQTGLVPVYLSGVYLPNPTIAPATLFTIHNLAYQGLFPHSTFLQLGLRQNLWHFEALEFHQQLSFIKGGLVFADRINTVSPHYAREIQTPTFGHGLDGLLRYRQASLSGILNGINQLEWDPSSDRHIAANYSSDTIERKTANKAALQTEYGLQQNNAMALLGLVGRLVEQKGIDILIKALPALLQLPIQLVILGSGDSEIERELGQWAARYPHKMVAISAYSESMAHRIVASADFFLMPSRFEPCGLTQLYSLRYGTIPVAHKVGGLVDTLVNINTDTLANGTATGVLFETADESCLLQAIHQALVLYNNSALYRAVQLTAMQQDYSWHRSAQQYSTLYQTIHPHSGRQFGT